jgi:hypothetical protein
MTRRDKRILAVVGGFLLAVLAGVGVWAAVRPGSYDRSHDGCITVSVPSSTGGGLLHQCGAQARMTCRNAFAQDDRLALLTRPQCRLAGLAQPSPAAATASSSAA